MLTLRGSATLLACSSSLEALIRIGREIGFDGEVAGLDTDARGVLGIPPESIDVAIVPGPGSMRALALTVPAGTPVRDLLTKLAAQLTSRTPHVQWILLVAERDGEGVAIGAPIQGRRPTRVAAVMVSRARVMDSDAETLRMLAGARSSDDLATHARFVEILGRDALSRRFFRTLEQCVTGLADSASAGSPAARREIALLYASRLLFLGFLEAKGWLDADAGFLVRSFDDCMSTGGGFHGRVMLPLFFGTLNTPVSRRARRARAFGRIPFLNGGLFTPTASEKELKRLRFTDDALGRFFGELFSRYRFTAREETSSFEEAAIDPEMLGRTFECLMAPPSRVSSGVFYTPHELVERVAGCAIEEWLRAAIGSAVAESLMRESPLAEPEAREARRSLAELRVLDPACGSGAFLVHALDRVAALHVLAGDGRPIEAIRRQVLSRSIFGVDVNPTAVWLCQLRLWLSIVIDTNGAAAAVPPLPNLDRNIRVGDSLAGASFEETGAVGGGSLQRLRERYTRATGRRKASLARLLDREERRLLIESAASELGMVSGIRRDLLTARRGRDLFGERYSAARDELRQAAILRERSAELRRRIRSAKRGEALPFSFPAHFADVRSAGGFSIVVGNPPWVRPHRLDARTREALRRRFVVARSAPWASGADAAGAGRGFSSQVDLAALFVERSLRLLAPGATMSLLLPAKLWRSLAGGGLRALVARDARLLRVEDYSDVPATFDAAVYPGLLVASRPPADPRPSGEPRDARITVLHRARMATTWSGQPESIAWDRSAGAPWILVPPEVRRAFDVIREAGLPLAASGFGRPMLGVKCGLNDAFVVDAVADGAELTRVASVNGRELEVETSHLRPVARGEHVRRWAAPAGSARIVWPHDEHGVVLTKLPPGLHRWLAPFRRSLMARTDARSTARWWSLFRTDGANAGLPRVIWADIGRSPRAAVLDAGDPTVPLNSCYVARCPTAEDALALAALLNSPLVAAWLSIVAEPARGGYRRYLGWTMSLLPLPRHWEQRRSPLAELAERARRDPGAVSGSELLEASIAAFDLTRHQVDPLLAWACQ